MSSVSCISATACAAVGYGGSAAGINNTLAEQWNGSEWQVQTAAKLNWATTGELLGISCTSASACTATGEATDGTGLALAESWNGTAWAGSGTPAPAEAKLSLLDSIVCVSATSCMAVGDTETTTSFSLAEQWSGNEWQTLTMPNPTGAKASRLAGVSCSSVSSCIAVGSYTTSAGAIDTLAEQWNGSEWKILTTPNVSGATATYLAGVSCTSSSACMAVGYPVGSGSASPVAEQWNGSEWKLQTPPAPSGRKGSAKESALSGVSCTSASACTAVGNYHHSPGKAEAFAERWNGIEWKTEVPIEAPESGEGSPLQGVSCTSPTSCTAVGYTKNNSGFTVPLAEGWNGTEWFIQSTPNNGQADRYLNSIACTSSAACTAVGDYTSASGAVLPYVTRWSNGEWSLQEAPGVSGSSQSDLYGVACMGARECETVGNGATTPGAIAFADRLVPEWTLAPPINPTGGKEARLADVACTSSSECIGVGEYANSSAVKTALTESWNGTSWTLLTIPIPSGAKASGISTV